MSEAADKVTAVHLYPIKSCQEATVFGEPITELEAGPTGLRYGEVADRGWVVANQDNLFVSQRGWDENRARKHRDDRLLATVAIDIADDRLSISAANHGSVNVYFEDPQNEASSVQIHESALPVVAEGEEAGEFFSGLLGRSVRLWRADASRARMLPGRFQREAAANRSAAADGRPISLASQASLDFLHELAEIPLGSVPLINFRANIDIEGSGFGAFGEDTLRRVRAGEIGAHVVKALSRCPVPNINQLSGDDTQKLATKILRPRLGWDAGSDTSKKAEPFFAQSLNHIYVPGLRSVVRVGDPVIAVETGEPNVILKSKAA